MTKMTNFCQLLIADRVYPIVYGAYLYLYFTYIVGTLGHK
jgi:hypothetical protein